MDADKNDFYPQGLIVEYCNNGGDVIDRDHYNFMTRESYEEFLKATCTWYKDTAKDNTGALELATFFTMSLNPETFEHYNSYASDPQATTDLARYIALTEPAYVAEV